MRPAFACQCHRNFYPRPPRGGRPVRFFRRRAQSIFLSTPSARRATHMPTSSRAAERFLSTPSARRATFCCKFLRLWICISIHALREEGDVLVPVRYSSFLNFYPRPPRGGRLYPVGKYLLASSFLSTPSARRATRNGLQFGRSREISIHALREEGDRLLVNGLVEPQYFYPRPPRGGRPPFPF